LRGVLAGIRAGLRTRGAASLERRLTWILGSPRSGSTWLTGMLSADPRAIAIDEPTVGVHLGVLMLDYVSVRPDRVPADQLRVNDVRAELPSYFFSRRFESAWRPPLRRLLLERLRAEVAEAARARGIGDPLVLIKEPSGSQAAEIIMSLLPRSRMIFLLRDGRDVIDSELDAFREGGWVARRLAGYRTSEDDRTAFIKARAHSWLCRTIAVERAYEAHGPDLRRLIRYEDLLADPTRHVQALATWLRLDTDPERLAERVRETAFEELDPSDRGPGQFARAASPGAWRENLTPEEQRLIDEIIGEKLAALGYA
jgi:hypothetical protein